MIPGWAALSPRDRLELRAGVIAVAAMLAWALLWWPHARSRAALREEARANAVALAWMRPAAAALAASGRARAPARHDARSLPARVDTGAKAAGLGAALAGIEPRSGGRVMARFAGADFDALAAWMQALPRDGLRVEALSVQRASGSGRVDAQLSLAGAAG